MYYSNRSLSSIGMKKLDHILIIAREGIGKKKKISKNEPRVYQNIKLYGVDRNDMRWKSLKNLIKQKLFINLLIDKKRNSFRNVIE